MTTASIGEHGIIGNMRSAALVNVFGGIDFVPGIRFAQCLRFIA